MFFYNGTILTMAENSAESLRLIGNKIGPVEDEKPAGMEGINLKGKTLLPGLCDTHLHLLNYGLALKAVNLRGCNSIEELQDRLAERVKTEEKGNWISGRGWDENRYDGQLPSRDDLDKVAPDHPVILSRVCGHLQVINSRAMEELGINDDIPIPEGGAADKDDSGRLTGIFREKAMDLIFDNMPKRSLDQVEEALIAAGKDLLSKGITAVHSDDLAEFDQIEPVLNLYQRLYSEGKLPRVHLHIHHKHLAEARKLDLETGVRLGDGITIAGVKIFADGSLGARTAALKDDYSDAPGEKGILIYTDQELYQMAKDAQTAGFALAIHAIGDRTAEQALKIIKRVEDENPEPHLRHRLIHAQILNDQIMEQMVEYNVIAEIQPIFLNTDHNWAGERLGERIKTCYNWQTMWQKGIRLSGSSDCPVEPVNPLWGIYCSVTRKDLEGEPEGGWYSKEALTLKQALHLFTTCAAYTGGEEDIAGSLEEGRRADLVILDRPIDEIPLDEIKDLEVIMTILDGKIVYQKQD